MQALTQHLTQLPSAVWGDGPKTVRIIGAIVVVAAVALAAVGIFFLLAMAGLSWPAALVVALPVAGIAGVVGVIMCLFVLRTGTTPRPDSSDDTRSEEARSLPRRQEQPQARYDFRPLGDEELPWRPNNLDNRPSTLDDLTRMRDQALAESRRVLQRDKELSAAATAQAVQDIKQAREQFLVDRGNILEKYETDKAQELLANPDPGSSEITVPSKAEKIRDCRLSITELRFTSKVQFALMLIPEKDKKEILGKLTAEFRRLEFNPSSGRIENPRD